MNTLFKLHIDSLEHKVDMEIFLNFSYLVTVFMFENIEIKTNKSHE